MTDESSKGTEHAREIEEMYNGELLSEYTLYLSANLGKESKQWEKERQNAAREEILRRMEDPNEP